jgi:hypothetical protein
VLAVIVSTSTASAQVPSEPLATAAQLFEQGRELVKQGRYPEACRRFERSYELDPAVGTQLNVADCLERRGELRKAFQMFHDAADAYTRAGSLTRAKFALDRADAVAAKLGTVIVSIAELDVPLLAVTIGGHPVTPAPVIRDLYEPGSKAIVVTAPGRTPFEKTVDVKPGAQISIYVPPLPPLEGAPPAPATLDTPSTPSDTPSAAAPSTVVVTDDREPSPDSDRRHTRMVIAWTLGGAGVVGGVTGIALGAYAKHQYQLEIDHGSCVEMASRLTCNAQGFANTRNAITLSNVGTVTGLVGLGLIAAAAVVYVTAPHDVTVAPVATAQTIGFAAIGRF